MTADSKQTLCTRPLFLDPFWTFSWSAAVTFGTLCLVLSFPGRMNADALFTFIAATKPELTNNWISATLGWFWNIPAPLFGQPTAALVMQAVLFSAFAGFIPRLPPTPRGQATLAGELILRTVLAGSAGYVGKDAVMLMALLIAVQILRRSTHSAPRRLAYLVLIAVALLFLLTKAPNFLVVVVALALISPFLLRSLRSYIMLMVVALGIAALAVPFNRVVDSQIFAARDLHPDKQIVLFDLAGISVGTEQNAFAKVHDWPVAALPPPTACYVPHMWDSFAHWTWCGGYARAYDPLDRALIGQWLMEIATHPLAYLGHRLNYIGYVLRSQDHDAWGLSGRSLNDATDPAAVAEMRKGMADLQSDLPIKFWRPSLATGAVIWLETTLLKFYKAQSAGLILCLSVLLFNWMRRDRGIRLGAIVAAALGVGNFIMLFVFGVADPARYMLPTVTLAYVALLAMLAPPNLDVRQRKTRLAV